MTLRDHEPIEFNEFNGLYNRGNEVTTPLDHFSSCVNLQTYGDNGFQTRDGIDLHQTVDVPLTGILRIYNFITQDKNTLLVLTTGGKIYHVVDETTVHGPILTIAAMEDFAFIPYAGRAYISPFKTYGTSPNTQEKGLQSEFLYVYLGDGTSAYKASIAGPTGNVTVANGAAGHTDAGQKVFAVVYETDTGALSPPAAYYVFTTGALFSVNFTTIPISPSAHVVARRIVATKTMTDYNGDPTNHQFYFIPGARLANNTGTTLSNISFYDADLLDDASHLLDNYTEIPAGAALTLYHNRLCLACTYTDISLILVSAVGEPEAISQIDGLIVAPLDGNPITNLQELRDIFYVRKRNRTLAYTDNNDVPSTWPLTVIDNGIGCPVHGVATVIDSGASSIDYQIVTSYRGIEIFNGRYADPELSYKISTYWNNIDRTLFRRIQILNDTVNKLIYVALPDKTMLMGDYSNGLDPKSVKWWPLLFDIECTTIALVNTSQLIIGSEKRLFE